MKADLNFRSTLESCRLRLKVFHEEDFLLRSSLARSSGSSAVGSGLAVGEARASSSFGDTGRVSVWGA